MDKREATQRAKEYLIDIERRCIDEARAKLRVINELNEYIAWCEQNIEDLESGNLTENVTFNSLVSCYMENDF